jgi:hypothetical protein
MFFGPQKCVHRLFAFAAERSVVSKQTKIHVAQRVRHWGADVMNFLQT